MAMRLNKGPPLSANPLRGPYASKKLFVLPSTSQQRSSMTHLSIHCIQSNLSNIFGPFELAAAVLSEPYSDR